MLVGADGTLEGQAVLELAFQQASTRGLPLTVLHSFHDVVAAVNGAQLVSATEEFLEGGASPAGAVCRRLLGEVP